MLHLLTLPRVHVRACCTRADICPHDLYYYDPGECFRSESRHCLFTYQLYWHSQVGGSSRSHPYRCHAGALLLEVLLQLVLAIFVKDWTGNGCTNIRVRLTRIARMPRHRLTHALSSLSPTIMKTNLLCLVMLHVWTLWSSGYTFPASSCYCTATTWQPLRLLSQTYESCDHA